MRITVASRQAVRYACLHFHYAKSVPVNTLGYNVYNDNNEWCGVVLFGTGANNNIGNEYNLCQGSVLELVRVALNGKQEHTSQAVALALKALKKDCPLCRLVVSYADCDQEHLGTIYQATNWLYVGTNMQNTTDSSWIVNGKRYHGRIISDWVKSRGGCTAYRVNSSFANTLTVKLYSLLRKASASISCQWISRCADSLHILQSRIRKLIHSGKKLIEQTLNTMILSDLWQTCRI
jgi:hypothetical protein